MTSSYLNAHARRQRGFTLVEIAIVLVIVGLLLAGVLKGQELIENSKIKSIAKDMDSMVAAVQSYRDRYQGLPGDSATATTHTQYGWGGTAFTAGNNDGDRGDAVDVLKDLVECCKDGEYGFRECAEQAKREDLKTTFLQRADDCRRGAQELNDMIRSLGGHVADSGSVMGAMHRGWVSVKSALTTYDDKAVLNEAERGEDNAKSRYMKALQKPLPPQVKSLVEKQYQGVQRNHDQVKMLRDSLR